MPTNLDEIRTRAALWAAPISPEAPTGTSARLLPSYELVIHEVTKLQSPAEAASVDWQRIVENGRDILQKRSKDLPIASYVAIGLQVTSGPGGGIAGLLEGTLMLGDLLEKYWPTLFPELTRVRPRVNALNFYVERSSAVLGNPGRIAADRELLIALQQAAERLSALSREKLANDSPGFGPLLKAVEQLVMSVPAAAAPRMEAPVSASQPAAAAPAPASGPPTLTDVADAAGYLREIGSALVKSALPLRQANSADPVPYRVLRVGLWLHLNAPPPNGPDGKTSVPPLAPPKRAQLEAMQANAKWPELLEESEAALIASRFNLDLHRISALALENLGSTHEAARAALVSELSAWLRRAPGAVDLIASDGSPMADTETKKWLDKEVRGAPSAAASEPSKSAGSPSVSEDEQKMLQEARKLVAGKKYVEAIRLVQARIDASPSEKARFALRMSLAKLCADSGLLGAAKALYQSLDEQCVRHDLDVWDPLLAASCLEGLLKCARGERGPLPPEFAPQLQRLCRLSPAAALSANGLLATR